jgi:hypothetical protein
MTTPVRYACAAAIFVLLVIHSQIMTLHQMVWACHLASLSIALGLALGSPRAVGAGVVFHIGQGIPAYLIDLISTGTTQPTSVLLHTLPISSGLWWLSRKPLPTGLAMRGWGVHVIGMVLAYWLTDPALNVMLVHEPWPVTAWMFPRLWMSWIGVSLASLIAITLATLALRAVWPWRS